MISIYSINLHAQENGNESDSQLTISTESTQQADTQNAEKASEQDTTFNVDVLVDRMKETKAIGEPSK